MNLATGVEAGTSTEVETTKGKTNPQKVLFEAANSLFQNILHISPLDPKIWQGFLPNSMIPIDRGGSFFRAETQN